MSDQGVKIDARQQQTVSASAEELQAVLQLVQRAPTTTAERLFAETLFDRWFNQIAASAEPGSNGAPTPPE